MWGALIALFVLIIDPYGVSPIGINIPGVNVIKPTRVKIDRDIKPFEVWRHQPRSVILGTSRMHEAMNPAALERTRFAPAYNAAIPAGSLGSNIANLDQYSALDVNLKTVFAELFLWNFLGQPQSDAVLRGKWSIVTDSARLFASAAAVRDAAITLSYNAKNGAPAAHIAPGGYYAYAPGHTPDGRFAEFPAGIAKTNPKNRSGFALSDAAFASFRKINQMARDKGIELFWIATPNHAYVDYYFEALDLWDLVEEWLTRLSSEATIYSFSQPNDWVYERVSDRMRYWHDPFHFSQALGEGIMSKLAGRETVATPDDFMLRLTPGLVHEHIEGRRKAIRLWAQENEPFAQEVLDELGLKPLINDTEGSVTTDTLTFDGRTYRLGRRIVGSVEQVRRTPSGYAVTGWAVDQVANKPVVAVVAAIGETVVAKKVPNLSRSDIAAGVASAVTNAGFSFRVPTAPVEPSSSKPIRIFALLDDGAAVQLASTFSSTTGGLFADAPFGAAAK